MSIFRRNKDSGEDAAKEPEVQVDLYSPEMIAKRLLWDIVPCGDVEKFIPLMNLVPDSPDVADMEHKASHERLAELLPLKQLLDLMVPMVAGITASAMLVNSGVPSDEESARALQRHHSSVVRAGLVAVIANLLDMGILTYSDGVQIR